MKKVLSFFVAAVFIFSAALVTPSCSDDDKEFTVTFDVDGGSPEPSSQKVKDGSKALKPTPDPTKSGFEFDGWFNGSVAWNFDAPVTANLTLKAHWTADAVTYSVTFDADGGAPSPDMQIVNSGEKATKPTEDPTKTDTDFVLVFVPASEATTAGLYSSEGENLVEWVEAGYVFEHWYEEGKDEDIPYNFDAPVLGNLTLVAKYKLSDETPAPIVGVTANDVSAAVAYVKENPAEYTLLLDADASLAPQTLDVSDVKLTIIGLGSERKINLSSNGRLFVIGAAGQSDISLTIGNNITLVGRSVGGNGGQNNNTNLVAVQNNGEFVMLEGSKITENTSSSGFSNAGVFIDNSRFIMKGGAITENITVNPWWGYLSTGLQVTGHSSFIMEGGNISNNTGGDVSINATMPFVLSGNAEIGVFKSNTGTTFISISSGWTGKVGSLNLHSWAWDIAEVIEYWEDMVILRAVDGYSLTSADVAKITLGNFGLGGNDPYDPQPISDTHKIEDSGENTGKLVAK